MITLRYWDNQTNKHVEIPIHAKCDVIELRIPKNVCEDDGGTPELSVNVNTYGVIVSKSDDGKIIASLEFVAEYYDYLSEQ